MDVIYFPAPSYTFRIFLKPCDNFVAKFAVTRRTPARKSHRRSSSSTSPWTRGFSGTSNIISSMPSSNILPPASPLSSLIIRSAIITSIVKNRIKRTLIRLLQNSGNPYAVLSGRHKHGEHRRREPAPMYRALPVNTIYRYSNAISSLLLCLLPILSNQRPFCYRYKAVNKGNRRKLVA